jgi:putative NADH-flavin reductase
VVLGANGGIGMQTVKLALNAGYSVTAILRTPSNLQISHPNLQIVQGNVLKREDLDNHLEDKDIIVSAIGKNSLKKTTLYSQGNKNVIGAMKRAGLNRAFFVSASGLEVNPSFSLLIRFATKFILQPVLHNMYADLWRMEKIIKESNINWTILRPPKLLNRPETGKYRTSIDRFLNKGLEISRADLAHYIVTNLTNEAIFKKTVEVAY